MAFASAPFTILLLLFPHVVRLGIKLVRVSKPTNVDGSVVGAAVVGGWVVGAAVVLGAAVVVAAGVSLMKIVDVVVLEGAEVVGVRVDVGGGGVVLVAISRSGSTESPRSCPAISKSSPVVAQLVCV